MMYTLDVDATVAGDADALWQVWTDYDRFAEWDPREQESRLDGAFAVGAQAWSRQRGYGRNRVTLTAIEVTDPADRRWEATTPLPGGRLVIDHRVTDLGGGRVRLAKRYTAYGPLTLLFRAYYGRRIRRELVDSFVALAAEGARVAAAR